MGGYDETPGMFAEEVGEYMRRGLVNIVGGCCGTTPAHIFELAKRVEDYAPRPLPAACHETRLSGLEPLRIVPEANFINVGERTNVAGSARFARLIREGNYEEALSIARAQVEAGAQIVDVCMDDGLIDGVEAMRTFLNLMASEPEIARVPTMIDSSKWEVLRTGLEVTQGKAVVNSISLKEGEAEFLRRAREIYRYGAAAVVMLFDERGQADTFERKIEVAERAYRPLRRMASRPATSSSTPTSWPWPRVFPSTTAMPRPSSTRHAGSRSTCPTPRFREASRTSRSPSAATTPCARRCTRHSSTTRSGPAWTWASSIPRCCASTTRSSPSCSNASRT